MSEDFPYEVTGSKVVYRNPWIKVREDVIKRADGSEGIYGVVEVNDSVAIVAVDEAGRICLVESYRHPFKQWFWELPGGGGDGENLLLAAQRELQEETGITASGWHRLGRGRVCNGISNEYQTNFLATGLTINRLDTIEAETRSRRFVALEEIDRMMADSDFEDNQSIAALYMYKNWLQTNN